MGSIVDFFNKVELEIIANVQAALADGVAASAKELTSDYKKQVVDKAVSRYYAEYSPRIYQRSESLYDAFRVKFSAEGTKIIGKLNGSSDMLPQHESRSFWHQSGGGWKSRFESSSFNYDSGDNGIPDKSWIFGNFLEGYHPGFLARGDSVVDLGVYTSDFERNLSKYESAYAPRAAAIIVKNIKQQCAKYF